MEYIEKKENFRCFSSNCSDTEIQYDCKCEELDELHLILAEGKTAYVELKDALEHFGMV